MNYIDALNYIEDDKKYGSNMGVHVIKELLEILGNPHKELKCIHIAGTNGKGSTASYIATTLEEAGYKVGLYSSPYLEKFNERVQINKESISDEDLAKMTMKIKEASEYMIEKDLGVPTHFEIITAIMFLYFFEKKVDYVVLEVGLGGRLDSTNVIEKSLISIMTTIDFDHVDLLGDTLTKIAREKAGIIKENGLVVSYPQDKEVEKVLLEVSEEKNAELHFDNLQEIEIIEETNLGSKFNFKFKNYSFDGVKISMIGEYQVYNASLAISALLLLREKKLVDISDETMLKGIEKTSWKGRLELVGNNPSILIDGAHNSQGARQLIKAMELFDYERIILVLGVLTDKDVGEIVEALSPVADEVIVTEVDYDLRKLDADSLAEKVSKYNNKITITRDSSDAVDKAIEMSSSRDLIVVAGSLYLVGEVRGKINLL